MVTRFHYDDEVLHGLLADKLPQDRCDDILEHVEACDECQLRIEALTLQPEIITEIREYLEQDFDTEPQPDFSNITMPYSAELGSTDLKAEKNLGFLKPTDHPGSLGKFDRYEVMGVIGRGGMGIVLRGFDTALARECAVKVLSPELATNATARRRFSREAKSAAAVVHEHVVPIQTVNEVDGLPYLVMPIVNGKSLQQRVSDDSGPLELVEILRIGMQISSGLAAAHAQGLVHRDVKPANILLENSVERVLIADFGLARAADDANMTRSQVVAGTPQYMSPEQARGTEIDARSDLFSLGSVLYFMCCGHSPFRASTTMGVLNRIGNESPRSIRSQNPDIPKWLESIVFKLLEKDPNHRFNSAEEVSTLLGQCLAHAQQPDQFSAPLPVKTSGQNSGWPPIVKWLGGAAMAFLFGWMIFALFHDDPFRSDQPGYPNWSPFTAFQWVDDEAHVQVNDQWYQLKSIHGVPIEEIVQACKDNGWSVEKRVSEDLVQVIRLMGNEIEKSTKLELIAESGEQVVLNNVEMTTENRREAREYAKENRVNADRVNANPFYSNVPGYPKWSPFNGIRWDNDRPTILVDGEWYELVSIHGVSTDEILAKCAAEGWDAEDRIANDLVQIIRLMGHEIGKVTDLELRNEEGKLVTKKNVLMTREKLRSMIYSKGTKALEPQAFLDDLNQFQAQLEAQFAYLKANDFNYVLACEEIREKTDKFTVHEFAKALNGVINQFIDGHASVSNVVKEGDGYLPFLVEASGENYVAIRSDRKGFLNEDYPYIKTIDGKSIDKWIKAIHDQFPQGSAQYKRRRGMRLLRYIAHVRKTRGIASSTSCNVELSATPDGNFETKLLELPLADERGIYGEWPRAKKSYKMENNLGYLRLPRMNDDAVDTITRWMPQFKNTDGLIVDVRGNGGGSRGPLVELAPYFMKSSDEPRIVTVAKYRLYDEFDEDHLSEARFVYRESNPRFNERERKAIAKFNKTFKPEWEPDESEFSEWHYMVFSKDANDPQYDYLKPVVILCDENCFSATDIFLGAFKGWPNVTLMGQASGGGSARRQNFQLDNTGIRVSVASMASFQPTGKLYDTRGIVPDVIVKRPPEYFLLEGEDVVLNRAIKKLGK